MAIPVVGLAPFGVRQDLVGLGQFLEAVLGGRVGIDVGMEFAREPAERLANLVLAGVALDAEHLVVVPWHRVPGQSVS